LTAARRVVALVLAAGSGSRFGGDKLLYTHKGWPLGEHIAITLVDLMVPQDYLAVCPADDDVRPDLFRAHGFEIIGNPHPEQGMGTSLGLGAARAIALDADALLVCLADMPYVSVEHLAALLDIDAPVVATESGGVRSPPAVFSRELLPQLATLAGDHGARDLLKSAVTVSASPELVRDFDTPEDFGMTGH
jgi:molybdenum cofactor cytidylyltransferase